jgi:hypothetical protein
LTELDAIPEEGGTLLDNTVVVWVNELGLGPFNHHSRTDTHVVIAGGRNAGLAQARFRDLRGVEYKHFLYTLIHAMGEKDVASFGDGGSELIEDLFA